MFNPARRLLTAIFFLFLLSGLAAMGAIPESQRQALIALYNSTGGDSWTYKTGWKEGTLHTDGFAMPGTEGTWYGVTVETDNVTWISLGGNGLSGTIPAALGGLPALQVLNLGSNQLGGSIPSELGNLTNLQQLYLSYNQLTGAIPAGLGNLTGLTHLYLPNNQLTGSIPAELGSLINLQQLRLSSNQLDGSIPASLGNLVNLQYLYLDSNGTLSGAIPPELGNLVELIELFLYNNHLTGSLPAELGNLVKLQRFWLTNNELTGPIPSSLGGMTALRDLTFGGNQLSGSIPASFGNLTNLTTLSLYVNKLTGPIPPELGNLTNLTSLFLSSNQLSGAIPVALANLTNLTNLNLTGNDLTGQIPTELGSLIRLNTLDLRYNHLSGTISSALGSLTGLRYLYLNGNMLAGPVPTSLMNLTLLSYADFGYNSLYTSDAALIAFLNSKDPDWALTQTIAPTGVTAEAVDGAAVLVSWTPIPYTGNAGYYKIYHAQSAGGPYGLAGQTADKSVSSFEVSGLNHGQPYYFVVQTHTNPNQNNWYKNHIESEYSAEVSATPWLQVEIRVAGTIMAGGSPVANVVMSGLPGDPATGLSGAYDVTVAAGWSGTVTPILEGYTFAPVSRTYVAVTEDQLVHDYAATAVVMPAVSVTAPNGGETWLAGSTQNVTWTQVSMTGNVSVDLYKGGVYQRTLGTPEVTAEVLPWTISGSETSGADYRVRIWQDGVSDDSDADFSVARAAVRVDFDQDGREDILWRYNGEGGYNRVWFLGDSEPAGPPPSAVGLLRNTTILKTMTPDAREPGTMPDQMRGSGRADLRDGRALMDGRAKTAILLNDPRLAGGSYPKASALTLADPRQVKLALSTGISPEHLAEVASSPYLAGGADVMPVGDLSWQIVGTGDFNNDTHVDILWRNASSGTNIVWFMNGTDWAGSAEIMPVADLTWQIVGTGDFNKDTHVDILWRNSASGDNVVWYMNGTDWAGSSVLLGVSDGNWQIVGTGDFNKDGNLDLLWRYNGAGGFNVVWYLENTTWTGTAGLISVGDTAWQIVGTGDYNKDGNIDILWRYNGAGGYNIIWYMNGVAWSESAELLPVNDLTWRIVSR